MNVQPKLLFQLCDTVKVSEGCLQQLVESLAQRLKAPLKAKYTAV